MKVRPRRRRQRDSRGTALVEAAFVIPLLILLTFGIIDYGLLFKNYLTVANSSRTGARIGSASGTDLNADYNILQAVKSSAKALPGGQVDKVFVFNANADGDPTVSGCFSLTVGTSGCNVYTPADLNRTQAQMGCDSGEPDAPWCPSGRDDVQDTNGLTNLGVRVVYTHDYVTKLFGSSKTINDDVIMRLEPRRS